MPTLTRRAPLDDLPNAVVCPAAIPIAGADPSCGGVVCAVMAQERGRETGVGLDAAQVAVARDGSDGVFLTLTGDPSTVERFCCGDGVPVLDEFEKRGGRDTYTYCPVWQAEKAREADGRRQLAGGGVEPEQTSHFDDGRMRDAAQAFVDQTASPFGSSRVEPTVELPQGASSSADADDPWAAARRDLDFLAEGDYSG